MRNGIELLAPVGNMEALYAAIENGADAVYFGGKLFNARQYASNFDYNQLRDAVYYAHLNNVKTYVTVNILIDNEEIEDIIDYIKFLYEIDVDAVIVQDIGLASLIRKIFPDMPIHASTQMTVNNLWGAKFLEEMGFSRLILARETPIEEIERISQRRDIELEVFAHGALCVSYSGQCLMSSMIGGRSGNRGRCAQPCRMKYSIEDAKTRSIKALKEKYILSSRDLNTIDYLDRLIKSGIVSLKIEGRMKRPEYVATIIKNYRRVIDGGIKELDNQSRKDILQIFNRDFTKGLGLGDFARSYISLDRPDNRGLEIGKVVKIDKEKVYIYLEEDIEKDDGIEFLLTNGRYRGLRSPFGGKKSSIIGLPKLGDIDINSLVHRTSSLGLLEKAKKSYDKLSQKYPINMDLTVKIGKKAQLKLIYKKDIIWVESEDKAERAENLSIDVKRAREQLSKLGGTVYYLEKFQGNIEDGAFLPISSLNELRRDAIEELDKLLISKKSRKKKFDGEFERRKKEALILNREEIKENKKLHIKVTSIEQFNELDLRKLDRIYLAFSNNLDNAIDRAKEENKEVYFSTGKILYEEDFHKLEKLINQYQDRIDGISVWNIGTYKFIKDRFNYKIHGDLGLNVFNSYSLSYLKSLGIDSPTLSAELNLEQIKKITEIDQEVEAIVYGYLPIMLTRTCPMALEKNCKDDKACDSCAYANGYGLRDKMNHSFKMYRKEGYTEIYNSVPLMLLGNLRHILDSGVSSLRLDFNFELEGIKEIQESFYDYIQGDIREEEVEKIMRLFRKKSDLTRGHYFRGIV